MRFRIIYRLMYEMSSQLREFCQSAGKLCAIQQRIESANIGFESFVKSMSVSREILSFENQERETVGVWRLCYPQANKEVEPAKQTTEGSLFSSVSQGM